MIFEQLWREYQWNPDHMWRDVYYDLHYNLSSGFWATFWKGVVG